MFDRVVRLANRDANRMALQHPGKTHDLPHTGYSDWHDRSAGAPCQDERAGTAVLQAPILASMTFRKDADDSSIGEDLECRPKGNLIDRAPAHWKCLEPLGEKAEHRLVPGLLLHHEMDFSRQERADDR